MTQEMLKGSGRPTPDQAWAEQMAAAEEVSAPLSSMALAGGAGEGSSEGNSGVIQQIDSFVGCENAPRVNIVGQMVQWFERRSDVRSESSSLGDARQGGAEAGSENSNQGSPPVDRFRRDEAETMEVGEVQADIDLTATATVMDAETPAPYRNRLRVDGAGFFDIHSSVEIDARGLPEDRSCPEKYKNLLLATVACGLKCPVTSCNRQFHTGSRSKGAPKPERDSEGHLVKFWDEQCKLDVAQICNHWEDHHFAENIRLSLKVACPFIDEQTGVPCDKNLYPKTHDLVRHLKRSHSVEATKTLKADCADKCKYVTERTLKRPKVRYTVEELEATFVRGASIRQGMVKNRLAPKLAAPSNKQCEKPVKKREQLPSEGRHVQGAVKPAALGAPIKEVVKAPSQGVAAVKGKRQRDRSTARSTEPSETKKLATASGSADGFTTVHRRTRVEKLKAQKAKKKAVREGKVVRHFADKNPKLGTLQVTLNNVPSKTGRREGAHATQRHVVGSRGGKPAVDANLQQLKEKAQQIGSCNALRACGLKELEAMKRALDRSARLMWVAEGEEQPSPLLALQEMIRCNRDFMGGYAAYHLRCLAVMERHNLPVDNSRGDQYLDTAARGLVGAIAQASRAPSAPQDLVVEDVKTLPTQSMTQEQEARTLDESQCEVVILTEDPQPHAPVVYAVEPSTHMLADLETFGGDSSVRPDDHYQGGCTVLGKVKPVRKPPRWVDTLKNPTTDSPHTEEMETEENESYNADVAQCTSVASRGTVADSSLPPGLSLHGPGANDPQPGTSSQTVRDAADYELGHPRVRYHPSHRSAGFGPRDTLEVSAQHATTLVMPTVEWRALVGTFRESVDILCSALELGQCGDAGVEFLRMYRSLQPPDR